MKSPHLVVFDIDGTLAHSVEMDARSESSRGAWPNVVTLARQYMERDHVHLMICTGRPKSSFSETWRWLNRHLQLGSSGKRVTLSCRPDDVPWEQIPSFKLHEILRAVRRIAAVEVSLYDDDVRNLAVMGTLPKSLVRRLRLFRCTDGVVTPWEL
jgi:hydroxymethylpyrimidine pyrophosphatase-like HAD family hydrolase